MNLAEAMQISGGGKNNAIATKLEAIGFRFSNYLPGYKCWESPHMSAGQRADMLVADIDDATLATTARQWRIEKYKEGRP